MKIASTKTIKVISRTLEITKRPKERNIGTRNVCITQKEKNEIQLTDTVILKVLDECNNLVAEAKYTGKEFHQGLVERTKRLKYGEQVKFLTLGY
jgi:hypothetical protein